MGTESLKSLVRVLMAGRTSCQPPQATVLDNREMNFPPESCVLCNGVRAKQGYTAIIIAIAVLYFTVLPGDTSRSYFQLQESFC